LEFLSEAFNGFSILVCTKAFSTSLKLMGAVVNELFGAFDDFGSVSGPFRPQAAKGPLIRVAAIKIESILNTEFFIK
jgi:hypothetical protein